MKLYIKVTRNDTEGSYIIPFEQVENMVDAELEGREPGQAITLTIVEMDEGEYAKLPEFEGW